MLAPLLSAAACVAFAIAIAIRDRIRPDRRSDLVRLTQNTRSRLASRAPHRGGNDARRS
jgi:hypothetical protein